MDRPVPAAFFEPASLGSLRRAAGASGDGRLEVYPQAERALGSLAADGVRLGVIAGSDEIGTEELAGLIERSALAALIERRLVVAAEERAASPFGRAIGVAGLEVEPERCLFVGEDRDMRHDALAAGLAVAPHVRLAAAVLGGARLRYIRATVPSSTADESWREVVGEYDLVPIRVVAQPVAFYAIATSAAAARLDDLGFQVDRLGAVDEPLATEVYLLRDDRQTRTGFLVPEGSSSAFAADEGASRVLASTVDGLYVAIEAGRSVESYHFEEARHGHTEKLIPDPSLILDQPQRAELVAERETIDQPVLSDDVQSAFGLITPERIASDLARYSGAEPLDESGARILSRHIVHPGNALAVETLINDLESIGDGQLEVTKHRFVHEGAPLANVEAKLSGADGDELVLVTAHLDSTAQFSAGYDPLSSPAPGADDDGSGLVAVLAVARTLVALGRKGAPKREIRLVLFNAEEHGLVGSKAYARDEAARGARIAGVFQLDMVGYNREPPRTFEVHAGFLGSAEVQQRSGALAERIAAAALQVSPRLPEPQIYLSTSVQERDPAEGRSDHASFQLVGYSACAASEDFFAGPGPASGSEPNPDYHMSSDTFVDPEYAADIARAVGCAAWLTANSP